MVRKNTESVEADETSGEKVSAKEKAMIDDWGRKLNYEPTKPEYTLYSSGPDGKSGTRDDLIYARSFDFLYEQNSEEQ